jgi:type III pantothenate kinase
MATHTPDTRLIIDLGNTRGKAGVFRQDQIEQTFYFESYAELQEQIADLSIDIVFVSNVSARSLDELASVLPDARLYEFSRKMQLPLGLHYDTPDTLGLDRIAAAVGAWQEFGRKNVLSIDCGSCITYDLVSSEAVFVGGAISPGVRMGLRAMHSMTGALPDLSQEWQKIALKSVGKSTAECMVSGAINGILDEMNGYIGRYREELGELTIIMTGGDAAFFESKIKEPIFVRPNLVLTGLNTIFDYNDH